MWVSAPYDIAPIRIPAKLSFSARYSQDGICGALGLVDQGVSEGSDMVGKRVARGFSTKNERDDEGKRGKGKGLEVRWKEAKGLSYEYLRIGSNVWDVRRTENEGDPRLLCGSVCKANSFTLTRHHRLENDLHLYHRMSNREAVNGSQFPCIARAAGRTQRRGHWEIVTKQSIPWQGTRAFAVFENVSACSFDSFRAATAAYDDTGYLELPSQVPHPRFHGVRTLTGTMGLK